MLGQIERYWSRRAPSYSEVVQYELTHENEDNWMSVITENLPKDSMRKVLDVGTGPGFFATGLSKRGYQVTAIDYAESMLNEARFNAGAYAKQIAFHKMDAQNLDFEDECFDAVVTRNLTWNLENPQKAYQEWYRVLKKGGVLINFDAGWYNYLFDDEKAKAFAESREEVLKQGVFDFNDYDESALMEEISRNLILSRCKRPETDLEMLQIAGFSKVSVDPQVGDRVLDAAEKINYQSTPIFMLKAVK